MLALKEMDVSLATTEDRTQPQFPSELLDQIAQHIYQGSFRQRESLHPFSLVSKHFRKSALPLLFGTVSHSVREELYHEPRGLFPYLLDRPNVLGYIDTLHLVQPAKIRDFMCDEDEADFKWPAHENKVADLQMIRHSLPYMHRLRCFRFDCSGSVAMDIIKLLPHDRRYKIIIDHLYTSSLCRDTIAAAISIASFARRHDLALGTFRGLSMLRHPPSQATYDMLSRAVAIDLPVAVLNNALASPNGDKRDPSTSPSFKCEVSWKELHLLVDHNGQSPALALRAYAPRIIPWGKLQRLQLIWQWTLPMSEFIHDIAPRLTSLRGLRLRATMRIFHPSCEFEAPEPRIFADPPDCRPFAIDYKEFQHLEELEIDGICNHIEMSDLMGPSLQALRLHRDDSLFSVHSFWSQRNRDDIRTAVTLSPELERLEVDVGDIDTLWAPEAIPGVDVDLKQYDFLNAVTKFRHLKFLRLFPPFVKRNTPRHSRAVSRRPPIADHQAIRIFDYLTRECPSLQLLSVAAIPTIMNVDTMFWEAKRGIGCTILTTGHRGRNYRHRQTWIGERRIRSEIKRFRVPPPYLPDFGGWLLKHDDIVNPENLS